MKCEMLEDLEKCYCNSLFTLFVIHLQEQGLSHFEVDLKSMRSTMKALEEELGTALVSQLNAEDQQQVHVWPL